MILRTIFFILLVHCANAQSKVEKFDKFQSSYHLEKVYVNNDKPFYLLGDTIWCQVVFVDGRTHQFFDASPIVYVDWMNADGELLNDYMLKIDQGLASFEIPTGYDDEAGEFILRAYTQYQRNFDQAYLFQKSIKIFSDSMDVDMPTESDNENFSTKLFPEGGEIITGLNNKVAVKAQNSEGENLEYTGVLIDTDEKEIVSFKSYNEGIGFFEFTPKAGQSYKVKINCEDNEKLFDLPTALDQGYTISINTRAKDYLSINLASNKKALLKGATLIGQVRGQLFLEQDLGEGAEQLLKIPRDQIPSGVLHFTLFDDKDRPVCQRLTFNKNPIEAVDISVDHGKPYYDQREKVNLKIKTSQLEKIIPSSFSVSVYNKDIIPSGSNDLNILNYLLLQSDLKGRIDNINQYFIEDNAKTNFLLDLLMLTHGWSRFTWQDILKEDFPSMEFATAESLPIIGVVHKHNKDQPVKADVFLSILSKADFTTTNMTTEEDGIFYFKGFEFRDTTEVLIQANVHDPKKRKKLKEGERKRTGNTNVDIEILELDKLVFEESVTIHNYLHDKNVINDLGKEFAEIKETDYLYHPEWSIDLEEVTIKGSRKTIKQKKEEDLKGKMKKRGMFYFPSSQKIFLDDLPGGGAIYQDIFQIIKGRVPGVEIKGTGIERYALIRNTVNIIDGDIPATIMVDGFELTDAGAAQINLENVLAIDVIKGLSASSVFGSSGAGGVISIITKSPDDFQKKGKKKRVKGSINIQNPGFYNAREFYTPNYDQKSISHQQPNLNTTLYWEPMIRIGKKEKQISFFTGDRGGKYYVKVEGITENGFPFVHFEEFTITDE